MKRITNSLLAVVSALLLIAALIFIVPQSTTSAQKDRGPGRGVTSADLDAIGGVNGARVFYQLTEEEQGPRFEFSNGTFASKVPAEVVFNYFGDRDDRGRLIFAVFIKRPLFLGGPFLKDEVPFDSARNPGTIDTIQPGDLRN